MSQKEIDKSQYSNIEPAPDKLDENPPQPNHIIESSTIPSKAFDGTFVEHDPYPGTYVFTHRVQILGRSCIFLICIAALIFGRSSVPDDEFTCGVTDHIQNAFESANTFIAKPENKNFQGVFQAMSSLAADFIFFATFAYWILFGKTSRFPVTLTLFYIARIIVLFIWFTPRPENFLWDDPVIPSLLISYEGGTGFFFSKYIGIMTICAKEWGRCGKKGIKWLIFAVVLFVSIITLIYKAHYCIDIFTGILFADWCFERVNWYKTSFDNLWVKLALRGKELFSKSKEDDIEQQEMVEH